MLNKYSSSDGYAVTEILLAVVIISIAFIEITRAYANISNYATSAISLSQSSNLAHSTMERIMAQDFDERGNEKGDYSLSFDGVNDYVNLGNIFNFTSNYSIEAWVKTSLDSREQRILTKFERGGGGSLNAGIISTGEFRVSHNVAPWGVKSSKTVNDGKWHHVAATYDMTTLRLYVDGLLDAAINTDVNSITSYDIQIGRSFKTGSYSHGYFEGSIDEVRIWNDVRTAEEILNYHRTRISNPYLDSSLKVYLRMNAGKGSIAFDHSSSMSHGGINGASWVTSWSTFLGSETENQWSLFDDVDDFNGVSFVDSDYEGLDANSNNFSGLGGRITVKYISLNSNTDPISFIDSGPPSDFKQITIKVGIPGTSDSTQLDAIKSAKSDQGYTLNFSPYGN